MARIMKKAKTQVLEEPSDEPLVSRVASYHGAGRREDPFASSPQRRRSARPPSKEPERRNSASPPATPPSSPQQAPRSTPRGSPRSPLFADERSPRPNPNQNPNEPRKSVPVVANPPPNSGPRRGSAPGSGLPPNSARPRLSGAGMPVGPGGASPNNPDMQTSPRPSLPNNARSPRGNLPNRPSNADPSHKSRPQAQRPKPSAAPNNTSPPAPPKDAEEPARSKRTPFARAMTEARLAGRAPPSPGSAPSPGENSPSSTAPTYGRSRSADPRLGNWRGTGSRSFVNLLRSSPAGAMDMDGPLIINSGEADLQASPNPRGRSSSLPKAARTETPPTRPSATTPRRSRSSNPALFPRGTDKTAVEATSSPIFVEDRTASPQQKPRPPRFFKAARGPQEAKGGHFEWVCGSLREPVEDEEQEAHDRLLARNLILRRPSQLPLEAPRSPQQKPRQMNAAFTDRANKMREGQAIKAPLPWKGPTETTDWSKHSPSCDCPVCQPHKQPSAGCTSPEVITSKFVRCAKDSPPQQAPWDKAVPDAFNSELLQTSLPHVTCNSPLSKEGETFFQQSMGRKIVAPNLRSPSPSTRSPLRASSVGSLLSLEGAGSQPPSLRTRSPNLARSGVLPHREAASRSGSLGRQSADAAGQFNQDYKPEIMACTWKARQEFQSSNRDLSPKRAGVALCISPKSTDPAVPTKITHTRRGDGLFKAGYSAEAESHTMLSNPEIFRFHDSDVVHGRNSPLPDYESHAGMTTKAWAARAERSLSPGRASPERCLFLNNSSKMSLFMDQRRQDQNTAREREYRLANETQFSSLCKIGAETLKAQQLAAATARSRCTASAVDFTWCEA